MLMKSKIRFELFGCLLIVSVLLLLLIFVQTDIARAEDEELNIKNELVNKNEYKLNIFSIIIDSYLHEPDEENDIIVIPSYSSDEKIGVFVINKGKGEENNALANTRVYYIDEDLIKSSVISSEFKYINNHDYNQITDHNYHNVMGTLTIQMLTGNFNNVATDLNIIAFDSYIN